MKHLLKLEDWSTEEIIHCLNLADQLKYEQKHGIEHKLLQGKTLGMIFEKSSTRTRVSFEVGMTQLGGYPLFLSSNDLQIGRGEPVQDTARVLSRFVDAIMIRTFAQSEVEALAGEHVAVRVHLGNVLAVPADYHGTFVVEFVVIAEYGLVISSAYALLCQHHGILM